jgi:TRAP-type C4-dicarboxylate transport system permease large subunit
VADYVKRGWSFFLGMIVVISVMIFFPSLVLFLPNLLF